MTHFCVKLCLRHKDLEPSAISQLLDIEPTCVHAKGTLPFSQWILDSSDHIDNESETNQVAHFEWILNKLWRRREQILQLTNKGIGVQLVCQTYTTDTDAHVVFYPEIMKRLSQLGLPLFCETHWLQATDSAD
jgi:hypothetical protein